MIHCDRTLSQKLEWTEAQASRAMVESRAAQDPQSGAEWVEFAGTSVIFDGPGSFLNQTFGLGMTETVVPETLDQIEAFFQRHASPVLHEVSPLADPGLPALLVERGYRPVELSNVMVRRIEPSLHPRRDRGEGVTTRVILPDEADLWTEITAAGWATEGQGVAEFLREMGRVSTRATGSYPFLAEWGGRPISSGMLFCFNEVALLAGASTVPDGRRRGGQSALLEARLQFAADQGCRLAMMGAAPGSQSQRNAESNGFQVAYTRTKWERRVRE